MEEGELSTGAAAGGGDELYNALHQRLVASGEWQRLLILLRRMLDESGWESEFQAYATTKAKQQPVLSVPDLIDVLTPHAQGMLHLWAARCIHESSAHLPVSCSSCHPRRYAPCTCQGPPPGQADKLSRSQSRRRLNQAPTQHMLGPHRFIYPRRITVMYAFHHHSLHTDAIGNALICKQDAVVQQACDCSCTNRETQDITDERVLVTCRTPARRAAKRWSPKRSTAGVSATKHVDVQPARNTSCEKLTFEYMSCTTLSVSCQ